MPAWFGWSLVALVSWGIWAVIGRVIGDALSPAHMQAVSTLGMLPIIAVLAVFSRRQIASNARKGALVAVAGGVVSCLGNVAFYDVLTRGEKAATVVPLTAMYPLVTIVLAVLVLRERLNWLQIGGVLLSLTAIYVLNATRASSAFNSWMLYALLPIVLWGATGFLQKLSTNDISGERSTLLFLSAFVSSAVIIVLAKPLPAGIPAKIWLWAIALGFFLGFGNLALLLAFARDGKASVITPLTALYPLVSIPLAVIGLGEKVSARESYGILLALLAVVALSWQAAAREPQIVNHLQHEIHH